MAAELEGVRKLLLERARARHVTLAEISRAAGKNDAYVHQFVHKGSPRRLPEGVRRIAATMLGIPEDALRGDDDAAPQATLTAAAAPAAPAAAHEPRQDVAVYAEGGMLEPSQAVQFVARVAGMPASWALWVSTPSGRLRPGDLVHVHPTQPPRIGDAVVVVDDGRIAGAGDLVHLGADDFVVTHNGGEQRSYRRESARAYRVVHISLA